MGIDAKKRQIKNHAKLTSYTVLFLIFPQPRGPKVGYSIAPSPTYLAPLLNIRYQTQGE